MPELQARRCRRADCRRADGGRADCAHDDCGGVTAQHGRYEVRAGNQPLDDTGSATLVGSWRRAKPRLNVTAMMHCAVEAELNFTLNRRASSYATSATTERTLPLSSELLRKYARFFASEM